jgi:multidrug efflux system membrane fusion protein
VTTVPIGAVQRGPAGAFVYVVDTDLLAHRRSVTIPYQDENLAVISAGVRPGEVVVTDGASRVTDGVHVKLLAAPAVAG